jgi:tryptophanase
MRKTIIEPFKIKMVEPLHFHTRENREKFLREAGYNLFLLNSEHITFDFLTDSGTTAMSAEQWASMMTADEVYAGSVSFSKFKNAVLDILGFPHVLPTHQGRAAERIFFGKMVKEGDKIPSNNHFDTTRANIEFLKGEACDLVISEGKEPKNTYPFKGNIDTNLLRTFCEKHKGKIPFGMITITNNTGGGQPVSLSNLKEVAKIYKKHNIPFIIDACRFAENAYFIKCREKGQENRSVKEIIKEIFSLADGALMSAKKDALVNIGGFIALKEDKWLGDLRNILILTEGFPTYGGLAARDLSAMAQGLYEVVDESYLAYRIATCEYMTKRLNAMGIPTVLPAGGHAVYIDAKEFLPHISPSEFPGQSLAVEMYLNDGIRSCEIGSAMFGGNAKMELVRMAFPRRVYTQSHFDYILEGMEELVARKNELKGMKIVYEPPFLRHFTARFDYI